MADSKVDPRSLSAKYTEDFAYPTIKDRVPVILTKIIDQAYRMKGDVKEKYSEAAVDDVKLIAGRLSKLKNEIQTDKPILPIEDDWRDKAVWNTVLEEEKKTAGGQSPSWFKSSWLYTECYFYRRVHETFQLCTALKEFDTFSDQKRESFTLSLPALSGLAAFLLEALSDNVQKLSSEQLFGTLLQVSLWGNKCDLSISQGNQNQQHADPVSSLNQMRQFILINDTDRVWELLARLETDKPGNSQLSLILDNAGLELFTDLCLVEFLVSAKLVSKVVIYPKAFQWFVSDVTTTDLDWTLKQMLESEYDSLASLGKRIQQRLDSGVLTYKVHDFWTYPHDFSKMKTIAPDLYSELAQADLILFKGDLNYRKLVQDRKWDTTTRFEHALGGFQPAPLCSLRTLKADTVVGLKPGQAEAAAANTKNWMTIGEYAVIQATFERVP